MMFKDNHEEEILQDDGETMKKMMIDECKCLIAGLTKGRAPPEGLWIAGEKFKFISCGEDERDDQKFMVLKMKLGKKNVLVAKTKTQYVVAMSDEEKNSLGTQGN